MRNLRVRLNIKTDKQWFLYRYSGYSIEYFHKTRQENYLYRSFKNILYLIYSFCPSFKMKLVWIPSKNQNKFLRSLQMLVQEIRTWLVSKSIQLIFEDAFTYLRNCTYEKYQTWYATLSRFFSKVTNSQSFIIKNSECSNFNFESHCICVHNNTQQNEISYYLRARWNNYDYHKFHRNAQLL